MALTFTPADVLKVLSKQLKGEKVAARSKLLAELAEFGEQASEELAAEAKAIGGQDAAEVAVKLERASEQFKHAKRWTEGASTYPL